MTQEIKRKGGKYEAIGFLLIIGGIIFTFVFLSAFSFVAGGILCLIGGIVFLIGRFM